ncbi:uncharacterized protein [Fopius arisanus]|uniref:Uncharacterized protein isoform X2 n=1 Tax=Fopius arisanus TaxID=64838 RepID=A0A9R1TCW1_9HYME|nr:PREDICTED: uncharacterized protein LOC105268869 isoform X2 [Fopius arisanus]
MSPFQAMIYTPTDYPYRASGSNRDGLVMPGTETFISLGGSMSDTTEDFRSLKLERRNCDVQYEYYEYSYSECITSCKIQDIAEKCGCIPFYYPVPANLDHLARCNMTDLRCLNHYRSRWHTLVPQIQDGGHPVQAFMDFPEGLLQCDCYPSCTSTDYTIFKTFVSKNGLRTL